MMKGEIKVLLKELESELTSHILPFWSQKMVDHGNGGFYGRIDGNNLLHRDAEKGSVLNARILWTYSSAFIKFKNPEFIELAERAYAYCTKHFLNTKNGGVYWLIDSTGNPIDTKNQIYALSFMIYGFTEFYVASQKEEALAHAIRLFRVIEEKSFDPIQNGYFEAYDENWVLMEDLRLSDKDANEKKTMNTHLHILEAYTNLYRVWKDDYLEKQLENLIRLFVDHIIDTEFHHFKLFFNENWDPQGNIISYGHDIEGSWLILEAAEVLGKRELIEEIREITIKMVDKVISVGIDVDGGLFYEADHNGIFDDDKHWWPQAEAMVGLINAAQISGEKDYLTHALKVWNFIKTNIIDNAHGEWHFYVNRDGVPYLDKDKAGFWKCPYHNSRACLEIIRRLESFHLS